MKEKKKNELFTETHGGSGCDEEAGFRIKIHQKPNPLVTCPPTGGQGGRNALREWLSLARKIQDGTATPADKKRFKELDRSEEILNIIYFDTAYNLYKRRQEIKER